MCLWSHGRCLSCPCYTFIVEAFSNGGVCWQTTCMALPLSVSGRPEC